MCSVLITYKMKQSTSEEVNADILSSASARTDRQSCHD